MNPFSRYPQRPGAHPQRPWWRLSIDRSQSRMNERIWYMYRWVRKDGAEVATARKPHEHFQWSHGDVAPGHNPRDIGLLVAYDREHPMPAPEPLCGQVWSWPGGDEDTVVGILPDGSPHFGERGRRPFWPPRGAVPVAGPQSPWCPPGWEPPREEG